MNSEPELLLQEVNALLAPLEATETADLVRPQNPILFVVGAPRSGHTLLSQVLHSSGGFATPSNFVSRFWLAPYVAAMIERTLMTGQKEHLSNFQSSYGKTAGLSEPHEFGHFLRRWLPFRETHKAEIEKIPEEKAAEFAREAAALEQAYGRILFLRNIVYGLNIQLLRHVFPRALFVVCRRNTLYQAQSILLARQKLVGSSDTWWSLRPPQYQQLKALPYPEQIAGQILCTYQEIESGLAGADEGLWLDIHYNDLCRQPREQAERIAHMVSAQGGAATCDEQAIPDHFEIRDVQRVNHEELSRLNAALEQFTCPS